LEAPLTVIRTETVLTRLPLHTLAKRHPVDIAILQQTPQGERLLQWDVSYSTKYGEAGPLAYKLDTLVINRRIDASDRPLPSLLRLGSLHDIATALRLDRQTAKARHALLQNASAFITATLRYTDREGTARRLDAGFTRYSVVFGGERLPNGQIADAVYLVLNAVYREVLNHAPVRPLDYDYLTVLPPTAQRFYELVSYKMFATLAHH
jgi:hypothetical protein